MTYDCFMLFNELDLLEIRLNELRDVVDHFVLVESPFTHSGVEKPLYFRENRERFQGFPITHIVVESFPSEALSLASIRHPGHGIAWTRENLQRDAILSGLAEAASTDMVMISDLDEIPRASAVLQAKRVLENHDTACILFPRTFYYYLDLEAKGETYIMAPRAVRRSRVRSPTEIRWIQEGTVIDQGGWHFGWLGGPERIIQKLESFAHQELNQASLKDTNYIDACLHTGKTIHSMRSLTRVPIDDSYPLHIRENVHRFRHLISPEGFRELARA